MVRVPSFQLIGRRFAFLAGSLLLGGGAAFSGVSVDFVSLKEQGRLEIQQEVANAGETETFRSCSRTSGQTNAHAYVSMFGFSIGGGGGGDRPVQGMGSPAFWGCVIEESDDPSALMVMATQDDLGKLMIGDWFLLQIWKDLSSQEQELWKTRHPGDHLFRLWELFSDLQDTGSLSGGGQTADPVVQPTTSVAQPAQSQPSSPLQFRPVN